MRLLNFTLVLLLSLLSACNTIPLPNEESRTTPSRASVIRPNEESRTTPSRASVIRLETEGQSILSSYTGSYALLIGESDYTNGWPDLETIPGELQQVQSLLKNNGFQVEKSLNLNARQLRNRFEIFINQYGFDENNRLLFFYSGHGETHKGKGYIVPTDAPNPDFDEKGFLQKALTMTEILAMARRMTAKHALFLFDSCFSGTVFKAKVRPKVPRQISKMARLPVRQFITAGSANETVPAKSVFTPVFVDALRYGLGDLTKDGYVTGQELGLYLQSKVPQHTDQTPQYGKIKDYDLSRGDFVFAVGEGSQVSQPVPPQVPVPVSVPPVSAPTPVSLTLATVAVSKPDRDRDGVADNQDKCPDNTSVEMAKGVYKEGAKIGCPIENDNDGVPDYRDNCPYNRLEELADGIDSQGCPIDTDEDGVADYLDSCLHNISTELSQGVDSSGCPLDRDQDGIADYQDSCLGTSAGVKVKQNGCPVPSSKHSSTGKFFRDRLSDGSQGPEMVWIPAGSFRMGDIQGSGGSDDKSVHRVSVSRFAMGRYEVTVGEFRKFIESSSYKTIADRFGSCSVYENRGFQWKRGANWDRTNFSQSEISPVVCVSWTDAVAYTKWLSEQTGHKYQLPTEEQWEYAARAGTKTNYWWGNEGTHEYANYGKGLNNAEREKKLFLDVTLAKGKDQWVYTSPIGSFSPNQFGLYDIAGNVREWVSGKYKMNWKNLIKSPNGKSRMMRGGSWYDVPRGLHFRGLHTNSTDRTSFIGFRVSRELD